MMAGKRRVFGAAFKAMGYDACPMIGFDPIKVAEIINLPSDHAIGFMLAVGTAVKPASRDFTAMFTIKRTVRISLKVVPGAPRDEVAAVDGRNDEAIQQVSAREKSGSRVLPHPRSRQLLAAATRKAIYSSSS